MPIIVIFRPKFFFVKLILKLLLSNNISSLFQCDEIKF